MSLCDEYYYVWNMIFPNKPLTLLCPIFLCLPLAFLFTLVFYNSLPFTTIDISALAESRVLNLPSRPPPPSLPPPPPCELENAPLATSASTNSQVSLPSPTPLSLLPEDDKPTNSTVISAIVNDSREILTSPPPPPLPPPPATSASTNNLVSLQENDQPTNSTVISAPTTVVNDSRVILTSPPPSLPQPPPPELEDDPLATSVSTNNQVNLPSSTPPSLPPALLLPEDDQPTSSTVISAIVNDSRVILTSPRPQPPPARPPATSSSTNNQVSLTEDDQPANSTIISATTTIVNDSGVILTSPPPPPPPPRPPPEDPPDDVELLMRASRMNPNPTGPVKKVAFLFMTTTSLPFQSLWQLFFNQSGAQGKYNVYIHADPTFKYDNPPFTGVFSNRIIPSSKPTRRNTPTLIAAARRLLAHALLDDPANYMFTLLSAACVPLRSFNFTYNMLVESKHSFIEVLSNESTGYGRWAARGDELMLPEVEFKDFRIGSQFWSLTRYHARVVVEEVRLWRKFRYPCVALGACFPEENYFPTLLSMVDPKGVVPATLTHVNWQGQQGGHPHTYNGSEVAPELIRWLRRSRPRYGDLGINGSDLFVKERWDPFLFARKFAPNCLQPLKNLTNGILFKD